MILMLGKKNARIVPFGSRWFFLLFFLGRFVIVFHTPVGNQVVLKCSENSIPACLVDLT